MKVGMIRCQQTEDYCPGTADFKVAAEGKMAFAETGPVEIVGYVTCGGCPGKRAAGRAKTMVKRGADAIVMTSCMKLGNPIGFPCPHFDAIKASLEKACGDDIKLIDWTH